MPAATLRRISMSHLSMFSLRITVSIKLPLRIGFRFWRYNNLLRCELSATTQQIVVLWVEYDSTTIFLHKNPRHNNIGCVFWVLCGICCVVASQRKKSLCCDSAISGKTSAGFCVGRLALMGHRTADFSITQIPAAVKLLSPKVLCVPVCHLPIWSDEDDLPRMSWQVRLCLAEQWLAGQVGDRLTESQRSCRSTRVIWPRQVLPKTMRAAGLCTYFVPYVSDCQRFLTVKRCAIA